MRQRITLVSRDDLKVEPVRGSGPGGQHRNKSWTGCRITHPPSGAVGEATDSRSAEQNRRAAFRRMTETTEFKIWLELVLHPEQVKVEVFKGGEWVEQRNPLT